MKKILCTLLICFAGILLPFTSGRAYATGKNPDTIKEGAYEYTVTKTGDKPEVALTGWESRFDTGFGELIIPEKVSHKGISYTVTSIKSEAGFNSYNATVIDIPSTVTSIEAKSLFFETSGLSTPVKIFFRCPASAFDNVSTVDVNASAIESIIYVPKSELQEYRNIMGEKSRCLLSELKGETRNCCGIKVAAIGDADVIPSGFEYDGTYYKVTDEKKHEVSVIYVTLESGLIYNKIYEQYGEVEYAGRKWKVTKLEYHAYYLILAEIKLPSSIKTLAPECLGRYVKKADLSDTSIEVIPSDLFIDIAVYDTNMDQKPTVTSVVLPDCCKEIKSKAFYNCERLKNITVPASVEKIGNKAFPKKCKVHTASPDDVKITLKNGVLTVSGKGVMDADRKLSQEDRLKVKKIVIEEGVTSIPDYAFYDFNNVTKIKIASTVREIGTYAFGNTKIKYLTIPEGVVRLGDAMLSNCNLTSLKMPGSFDMVYNEELGFDDIGGSIKKVTFTTDLDPHVIKRINARSLYVSEADKLYSGIDGLIYTKDGKKLVAVPRMRKYPVIADGCEIVDIGAFLYDKWVGDDSYYALKNSLKTITFPSSVKQFKFFEDGIGTYLRVGYMDLASFKLKKVVLNMTSLDLDSARELWKAFSPSCGKALQKEFKKYGIKVDKKFLKNMPLVEGEYEREWIVPE